MSSSQNNPWPTQTPLPPLPPPPQHNFRSKRRRVSEPSDVSALVPRQIIADSDDVDSAETTCRWAGNDVTACFPTTDTSVPQHQWATFVWNSKVPEFVQTNLVNIYLYRGDSLQQIESWTDYPNPYPNPGVVRSQVDDTWWGNDGEAWDGQNITYPFYWVITRADKELDGSQTTQAIFSAVQTTYADSVVSSMASTASSASAAAASLSSLSAAGSSLTATPNPSSSTDADGNASGNVQSGGNGGGFPEWAIAVIVILGFFAIATSCILAFFIIRRVRRRAEIDSNRNSMGSSSPMMAHVGNSPGSPLLATGGLAGAGIDRHSSLGHGGTAENAVSPDGASTISRAGSAGDTGPFSGADAAIMADAFRKALRKPDFAGRPVEEGESPDNPENKDAELLSRELAEEGRDIRSVSSSRGVRVETLSDSGSTIQDHR